MIFPKPKCNRCGECCKYAWHKYNGECNDNHVIFFKEKNPETYVGKGLYYGEVIDIIYVPEPCQHLTSDNKCRIQNSKPEVCKGHGTSPRMFYPEKCVFFNYYKDYKEREEEIGC